MCSGAVAPTTAPTSLSPGALAADLRDEPRDALPDRAAGGELEVLDVGGARVRGADQHEDPGPGRRAAAVRTSSVSRPMYGFAVKASAPRPSASPQGVGVARRAPGRRRRR